MRDLDEIGFFYAGLLRARPAPTAEQLAATEARVGATLPADYKTFLARQNGGAPKLNFIQTAEDAYSLECFHYVDGKMEDVYDVETASERPSEDLEEQVVAIASDGSGDHLILRRREGEWAVEWWRHDGGPPEAVADSFSDLLAKLIVDPYA